MDSEFFRLSHWKLNYSVKEYAHENFLYMLPNGSAERGT